MARNAKSRMAMVAVASGIGCLLLQTQFAGATLLTGPVDTIYSDNFSGTGGNAIAGNVPTVASGLDGGTAGATWTGISTAGTAPDAVWDYSGSNSATITSPSANVTAGEDPNTIVNIALPVVPVMGYTYDLEATISGVNPGTGGHGLEMAFLYNGGNGHLSAEQAISNNDPAGLILYRDAAETGPNGYFDIFESTGTGSDNRFAPSSNSLTGGSVGQTVTVDAILTPLTSTSVSMNWYLNGVLANPSPVTITGLTNGISDIQIGDNRIANGTITGFSLTAVPEPASAGLLAISGLVLGARRRRR